MLDSWTEKGLKVEMCVYACVGGWFGWVFPLKKRSRAKLSIELDLFPLY